MPVIETLNQMSGDNPFAWLFVWRGELFDTNRRDI